MHFLRLADFKAAQKPDFFIANSKEVKARIEKFYRRNATIIYPPLETKHVGSNIKSVQEREYYLVGGRLARPKHIELAVLACTKLNLPLKVFGREFSGYGKELHQLAGPTVEFLGEISDEKKWELYQGAKAFFFPAEDEYFGIMPVEAMSVGTPVIAYKSGGVKETVIDGKTGIFFDSPTMESLLVTLNRFEKLNLKAEDCIEQAEKFSKERFKKEIQEFVSSKMRES